MPPTEPVRLRDGLVIVSRLCRAGGHRRLSMISSNYPENILNLGDGIASGDTCVVHHFYRHLSDRLHLTLTRAVPCRAIQMPLNLPGSITRNQRGYKHKTRLDIREMPTVRVCESVSNGFREEAHVWIYLVQQSLDLASFASIGLFKEMGAFRGIVFQADGSVSAATGQTSPPSIRYVEHHR